MELSEKQRRFTARVAELIRFAYSNGLELTLGEAYRTEEQQKLYLKSGKSRTMASPHRERLAVDLNLFIGGKYVSDGEAYRPLGEKWESLGGRWGGRFGVRKEEYGTKVGWDANHFEY
ncbi:MAG: M15 family metallopeptidase [Thermodesulfobacteriota bacterium]|nr:MAG: M15 family metallopeptidase [Thermodesulfobacteriota bacterium]